MSGTGTMPVTAVTQGVAITLNGMGTTTGIFTITSTYTATLNGQGTVSGRVVERITATITGTSNINAVPGARITIFGSVTIDGTGRLSAYSPNALYRLFIDINGPVTALANSGSVTVGTEFEVTQTNLALYGFWWWVCPSGAQSTTAQEFALWQVTSAGTGCICCWQPANVWDISSR